MNCGQNNTHGIDHISDSAKISLLFYTILMVQSFNIGPLTANKSVYHIEIRIIILLGLDLTNCGYKNEQLLCGEMNYFYTENY